jgi:hypothetical protein
MTALRIRMQASTSRARQRGQALVYGLFVLIAGLAALFFMFNTGQLTAEKTKLVNTADAVAYSAAVMHARALNFDAYTNRAMMANEVMIAQMVSVSSWLEYAEDHTSRVAPLNCLTYYSVPIALVLVKYEPLCVLMAYPYAAAVLTPARSGFDMVATGVVAASEAAKVVLQASQVAMFASFLPARKQLMQQVADANYAGLGPVKVDTVPLLDNYTLFDGQPFISAYTGNERGRFRDVERTAAYDDHFVSQRGWHDSSPWACNLVLLRGDASHAASTVQNGFDGWTASDHAELDTELKQWHFHRFGLPTLSCDRKTTYPLGQGHQSARTSGGDWYTSGVPSFFDLSLKALDYTSDKSDPDKREPRLQFAIRLTRAAADLRTSSGTSPIKPSGEMAIYQEDAAKNVMSAVSSSEVYFERTAARTRDSKKEQASLFNPYWQAHLIDNSSATKAAALALQQVP